MQLTSKSALELNKAPSTRFVTGNCDFPAHSCEIETVSGVKTNEKLIIFVLDIEQKEVSMTTYIGWNTCCDAD